MVKLIVCDLDGTLVNEARELSSKTREVLNEVFDAKVKFGIASGRPTDELRRYVSLWNLSHPFDILIGMNGSELFDEQDKKTYSFYKLKREWIKDILDIMRPFDLNPYMYVDGRVLTKRFDEDMKATQKRNGKEFIITDDETLFYREDNAKVLYRTPIAIIDEVEEYARSQINGDYKVFKTQPNLLEFAHTKTDKVNALLKYCDIHAIDLKDVVAFGDASNDDGIIKKAGTGIAMKNAIASTKEIADIVLDKTNDEDGVAYYIEDFILKGNRYQS